MSEFLCKEDEHGGIHLEVPVVPVVRCRDCASVEAAEPSLHICTRLGAFQYIVDPDGFCAWGVRRDGA